QSLGLYSFPRLGTRADRLLSMWRQHSPSDPMVRDSRLGFSRLGRRGLLDSRLTRVLVGVDAAPVGWLMRHLLRCARLRDPIKDRTLTDEFPLWRRKRRLAIAIDVLHRSTLVLVAHVVSDRGQFRGVHHRFVSIPRWPTSTWRTR